jgi:hypothetical protein
MRKQHRPQAIRPDPGLFQTIEEIPSIGIHAHIHGRDPSSTATTYEQAK